MRDLRDPRGLRVRTVCPGTTGKTDGTGPKEREVPKTHFVTCDSIRFHFFSFSFRRAWPSGGGSVVILEPVSHAEPDAAQPGA